MMDTLILLCTLVNLVLATFLYRYKWKMGSPFSLFYFAIILFFLIPSIGDRSNVIVDYHPFANPIFLTAETLTLVQLIVFFCLFSLLALEAIFRPCRIPNVVELESSGGILWLSPIFCMLLLILGYLSYGPLIFYAGFSSSRSGDFGLIPLLISYFAILSIPLPAYLAIRGRYIAALFFLVPLAIPMLVFGGARQMFVISLILLIFSIGAARRWSPTAILILACVVFPILEPALEMLRFLRNQPDFFTRIEFFLGGDFLDPSIWLPPDHGSETNLRFVFYQLVDGVEIMNQGDLNYLLRTVLFWMPSFLDIFGIKPGDFEAKVFSAVMGGREGTMHATFFGMILADGGYFLWLWILLVFGMMRGVEAWLSRNAPMSLYLYLLIGYLCVMWARGSIYAPIVMVFFASALFFTGQVLLLWVPKGKKRVST